MGKIKYWNIRNILSKGCIYNVIYGERSNGKTYGCLQYGIEEYFTHQSEFAIVRRMEEDFRGKRGSQMFDSLIQNGVIEKFSKGKYNSVKYYSQRWYFQHIDNENPKNNITSETPFAYAFALSTMEHDKSTSYPRIKNIFFDECLTRNMYLADEFILFQNVLSTIIRERDDVKIFMMGNTVNKYCPYFKEMGLTNIKNQKQGSIDIYTYGNSNLSVAVEYCDNITDKKSNKYFAFDNPKLKMITSGKWEIDIYPHLPMKYKQNNIVYMYFIVFDDETLQCEIISTKEPETNRNVLFTYIHRKTSKIDDSNGKYLVYQDKQSPLDNYHRNINRPTSSIEKKILSFFIKDKVFYQDNDVGEIVRNYLQTCKNMSII